MFFDATPNVLYPDFFEAGKVKLSKNLFRRIRPRDSFNAAFASSRKYTILPGETPDSISTVKYNDPVWYWSILLINNITDMNTQWPLDSDELDKYILDKYGEYENKPRHWETNKIVDESGNVVLEDGIIIEMFMDTVEQNKTSYWPDWTFTYYDNIKYDDQKRLESSDEVTVTAAQNLTKVTNREYEYQLNELKREIYLVDPKYLRLLEQEVNNLLAYDTKYKITDEGYRQAETA